jgi:tetratricopeptide (TPR) repeat protein
VTDFGLSKVLIPENMIEEPEVLVSLQKQSLYATQGIIGTLFYVSPEQILGDTIIDCRSDIYSLGVMLYELVTHRLPFYPDPSADTLQNQTSLLFKHLKAKPLEPVDLNSKIPRSLNRIILKCLEKSKEKRFNNYEGLIDELRKVYRDIRNRDVVTSQDFFEVQITPLYSETALLNNRACSYLELGNYQEAVSVFDKILNVAPDDIHALCNKANALMRLGRCNESIPLLKQALRVDASDAETWALLGVVYNRTGNHDDALSCCDKALTLDSKNPQYIKDKAFVLKDLCRFDEATSLFRKVTEIKSSDFAAWHELALLYEREGQTNEAIRYYMKALEVNPEFSYSLDNLGCLLCRIGDLERGIPCIEKALRIDPNNSKTWNNLGVVYGNLGRYKEAIEAYRQAVRIKPDYSSARYNLGVAYLIIGDKDSALKEYEILRALDEEKAEELKRFGFDEGGD